MKMSNVIGAPWYNRGFLQRALNMIKSEVEKRERIALQAAVGY
jgi:hypothetical protein